MVLSKVPNTKRRGVSSVVGGLFVLLIIVFGITTFLIVSNSENSVHQSENSAAQIDTLRNQEKLQILGTAFGGSQTYSSSSSYVSSFSSGCVNATSPPQKQYCGLAVTTGSSLRYDSTTYTTGTNYVLGQRVAAFTPFNVTSSTTTGYQEGLSNMNFSTDINGWTVYSTSIAVTGGFISTQGNPIPGSGVGSMFFAATCIAHSVTAGNESTRFYLDPSATGVGGITAAAFSLAEYSPTSGYSTGSATSTISAYLLDETSGKEYSIFNDTIKAGDVGWTYNTGLKTGWGPYPGTTPSSLYSLLTDKGYYDIIIASSVAWTSCGSSSPQVFIYFDDIGLSYGYNSFVTDWNYAFRVGQTPSTITSLSFAITTFYNQSGVSQYVYLYNWVLKEYQLFSTSTVSTQSSTVNVQTSVTNTGQYSVQNLVANNGTILLRMYSTRPSALSSGALGDNMETDVGSIGGGGLSTTLGFTSKSAFTVTLYNAGPQPLEIVEIGIIDSNGHSYINGTGINYFNGTFSTAVTFDQVIYPLQTVSTQIGYTWAPGSMSLVFVTSRGNAFIVSAQAS